jgi:hypothetical protein
MRMVLWWLQPALVWNPQYRRLDSADVLWVLGTGEQMAHTMIASKAVERMFESEDEFAGLQAAIERDFMGLLPNYDLLPLVTLN